MSSTNVQFSVAAHVMAVLAYHGQEATSALLAESVNADPSFVRKLVSKLSKAGLIKATRGKGGACALARPAQEITLLDIYRASNVPQAFTIHAYPVEQQCTISACIKSLLAKVLLGAQSEFEKSLARQTLQDLVAGATR
jgi:Rrf2 family protein